MKKLIHKYLSDNYHVDNNYILLTSSEYKMRVTSDMLAQHVGVIFNLTKKQLKWYVKSWLANVNPRFKLNDYWATPKAISWKNIKFPKIRRVYPRTIASDLVSVQPMEGPTGQLFYMDFVYGQQYI